MESLNGSISHPASMQIYRTTTLPVLLQTSDLIKTKTLIACNGNFAARLLYVLVYMNVSFLVACM
ncbi:unnamed protein product, partial [Urochloa humidicola]